MRRMDLPCQLALEPTCVMMWKVTGVSATVHDDSDDEGHEFDEQKVDHPKNVLVIALSCRFMFLAIEACMHGLMCFCFGLQHVYGHVVLIQGSWPST